MSFILEGFNGDSVQVNAWNWRPTLELLLHAKIIGERAYELMGVNWGGGAVKAETATRIADFLDQKLQTLRPGERLRADLTVTSEPKKPAVFTPAMQEADIDAKDIYSATYEWLVTFREFSRRSKGFRVC